MPNIKSASKRVLVNSKKLDRNKAIKSELKTVLKKTNAAFEANSEDKAEIAKVAVKKIDQACAKGVMHKNKAARKKSQIAVALNASN